MNILVVDDEPDVKELFLQRFRREIRNQSLQFNFALSGEEALNFLSENHSEAILILSDINMPGMSGFELLKKIQELILKPVPKVMMITAYNDNENRRQAMELGASDFLSKPIDFVDLKKKLLVN